MTGWKDAACLDSLAAASAETGDFAKAVEYQTRAAALATGDPKLEPEVRRRIGLYERKRPYRDPVLAGAERGPPPREVKR